jgi:perosamine synthetase
MIAWWNNEFGDKELQRLTESFRNRNISQGLITELFEKKICDYLGVKYTIAVSSGSTAILLALMSINVGPGDEVIIPNRTWISTAHAVHLLGAKVVTVDVQSTIPVLNVSDLERSITPRTKAIIPVHMNGRSSNMTAIKKLAKKHKLVVIEDAAQAIGSKNKNGFLGTQSDLGCFSLSVAKTISSGQGGFVVTNKKYLAHKIKAMRTHGLENVKDPKNWIMPGFNFRFTDLLASIAIEQLKQINKRIDCLKKLYKVYELGLRNTSFEQIPVDIEKGEVPVYIEYLVPSDRKKWISYLRTSGIETRPFYPNIDSAKYLNCRIEKNKNSKIFSDRGIYLPSGPSQNIENAKKCIQLIKRNL